MQLLSSEVALSLLCVVEELGTLYRPSTVALNPELKSAVIVSLCEGTTVSSTLLRTKISSKYLSDA